MALPRRFAMKAPKLPEDVPYWWIPAGIIFAFIDGSTLNEGNLTVAVP